MALGDIFNPILDLVKKALGPFGKVFDLVTKFWTTVQKAWTETLDLTGLIVDEVAQWKRFKEAIPFKTGVVSVPAAIKNTQSLIDEVIAAWRAIVDLATTFKEKLDSVGFEDPAAEARAAVQDIEESGFKALITKFPKLAKGLEKLLAWLGLIVELVELWISLADDLTAIVKATRDIREEVETGSSVFLSQKNPRRYVKLADGGSIKIRVGNLHS